MELIEFYAKINLVLLSNATKVTNDSKKRKSQGNVANNNNDIGEDILVVPAIVRRVRVIVIRVNLKYKDASDNQPHGGEDGGDAVVHLESTPETHDAGVFVALFLPFLLGHQLLFFTNHLTYDVALEGRQQIRTDDEANQQ